MKPEIKNRIRQNRKWLSQKEAAAYLEGLKPGGMKMGLEMHVSTLIRHRDAGEIAYCFRRKRPIYNIDELDRFNRPKELHELA